MTLPSTPRRAGPFNGNGSATSFAFTFKVFGDEDIRVVRTSSAGVETALVLDSDYSVTLNGDQEANPGGSVTYPISGSPLPIGQKLTIAGALEYDQPTDIPDGGNFSPTALENALDRISMQIQQLVEEGLRSVRLPVSVSGVSVALPTPEANDLLAWNGTGTALENRSLSELATVVAYADWRTDLFDGTGAQTAFTLAVDPVNVNNLDVVVSGVPQRPGEDYTLAGTTLTFSTAPPSGTKNVMVRYGEALPQGTVNATQVFNTDGSTAQDTADTLARLTVLVSLGAGVDNAAAINAALASSESVYLADGTDYGLTSKIVLNADKRLFGPGRLKPLAGFADRMVVQIDGSRARLEVDRYDGAAMTAPTAAWTGGGAGIARSPVGCAVFVNGSAGTVFERVLVRAVEMKNFPSGPICAFYAPRSVFSVAHLHNNHTYTANATNGVIDLNHCHGSQARDSIIDGYAWKGCAFGNSNDTVGINIITRNGGTGHAAHYLQGGGRSGYINCAHLGTGDSHKAFEATDTFVFNYTSINSTGVGVYFDSCDGAIGKGLVIRNPASYGVHVTAVTAFAKRTVIDDFLISRSTQGASTDESGIYIKPNAGGFDVDTIAIGAGILDGHFYGIWTPAGAGVRLANLTISDQCHIKRSAQYDVIGYAESAQIACQVDREAAFGSAAFVFMSTNSGVPGRVLDVSGLRVNGFGTTDNNLEIDGAWDSVIVSNLKTRSGGRALRVNSGCAPKNLTITGVDGYDAAQAAAVEINLSTALTTLVHIDNIRLPIAAGGYRSLTFNLSGGAALTGFVSDAMPGLAVNGGTNRPRTVQPFMGTGSPEGVVTAPVGSVYTRTDGGAGTARYHKESGTGNTGWVGK